MKKSYEERQAEWVMKNNITIGDKVIITRDVKDYEDGWCNISPNIENWIGERCFIKYITFDNIGVYNPKAMDWCYLPYFVLKKVQSLNEWTVSFGLKVRTGDPVLVRDGNYENWQYSLFSHVVPQIPFRYYTVGNPFLECIPYVGNEHLLGTMESYQQK